MPPKKVTTTTPLNEETKPGKTPLKRSKSLLSLGSHITVAPRYEETDRGYWASKTEFILSCIGYAVGITNVCRFPYLCYRSGGGAFLIPYLIMLFFIGIPLYMLEIIIGQFSRTGAIGMFRMSPFFQGAGVAIVIVNFICVCYYAVLLAYPIRFLSTIFVKELPWEHCNNTWNTDKCVEVTELSPNKIPTDVTNLITPADEFFHNKILEITDSIETLGGIVWPLFVSLVVAWIFVYLCIMKGVKSVGKVIYFTAIFPYVVLFIFFVRGVTLPGASKGIIYYIKPEWDRLLDLKVWTDAAVQIFFSLGPGWGGIVNMASFNAFRNNAKFDAVFLPCINCATSIFAGFVVFSVLGFLSHQTGLPIENVAASGPGLAFITYPQAISMLPIPHLWSVLFFCMIFFLGIDSVFVQIESITCSILDCVPKVRPYKIIIIICCCLVMFGLSIITVTRGGMYVLQLLDWYSASISVIMICLVEVIMVSWVYGVKNFADDYQFMLGERPHWYYVYSWKYSCPILLLLMFFTTIIFNRRVKYRDTEYPDWAIAIGWSSCVVSIMWIPLYMLYVLVTKKKKIKKTLRQYLRTHDWMPDSDEHRAEYEEFKRSIQVQAELDKQRKEQAKTEQSQPT